MIVFHRLLIGTFILFLAGFSAWSFVTYQGSGRTFPLVMGTLSALAAAAFSYYLRHLQRFLGR